MLVDGAICIHHQVGCCIQDASATAREPLPGRNVSEAALDDAALAALDDPETNSDLAEDELVDVLIVSLILGIDEQLEEWVHNELQDAPPRIPMGELDTDNFTALCPEHLPVLEMMQSMNVFSPNAWKALQPMMQALKEEMGTYTAADACCCLPCICCCIRKTVVASCEPVKHTA